MTTHRSQRVCRHKNLLAKYNNTTTSTNSVVLAQYFSCDSSIMLYGRRLWEIFHALLYAKGWSITDQSLTALSAHYVVTLKNYNLV